MSNPRIFLCGQYDFDEPQDEKAKIERLNTSGQNSNINIEFDDLRKPFADIIPDRLIDLIEIAAYVYAADSSTKRGNVWTKKNPTEAWARDFSFKIAVRDKSFWKAEVDSLKTILKFLSDDKFSFEFYERKSTGSDYSQAYFPFDDEDKWPFEEIDTIALFSGGLDSLSGAIDFLSDKENLALVSHRPTPKIDSRQKKLVSNLKQEFPNQLVHIPVWVNKSSRIAQDYSQRTRSFLFASIAAINLVALRAKRIVFFENGVISLNLPVADEVLRARASRTTHPYAIHLMEIFFSKVLNKEISIENPFLYKTKAEVIEQIQKNDKSHLIADSISCAHTITQSKSQRHCGTCSQCIDRRISIFAAGLEKHDLADDYTVDVFTGDRKEGYEKNMAVNYTRHVGEIKKMSNEEFYSKFSLELGRSVGHIEQKRSDQINELIDLHSRFAHSASEVLEKQVALNATKIVEGSLPDNSLLAMLATKEQATSLWIRFADEISNILQIGLPKACKTNKPKHEPHLQEICDGILTAREDKLIREFPFQSWSSSYTKPDYSDEELNLWVELKYVRKNSDIRNITEDIAADITKYSDNNKKTLFAIYDPQHLIVDEDQFLEPFQSRNFCMIRFIR